MALHIARGHQRGGNQSLSSSCTCKLDERERDEER